MPAKKRMPVATVTVEEVIPPTETTPVETTPVETTPVETAPTETTPTETAPTETAPAPKASKKTKKQVAPALTETSSVETSKDGRFKFTCAVSDLHSAIATVYPATGNFNLLPVLANLKIQVTPEGIVTLTGFDLALGLVCSFQAIKVELAGVYSLPSKLLYSILGLLPAGEITLDHTNTDNQVTLITTGSNYSILGLNAEEFPDLPSLDNPQKIAISTKNLKVGLASTLFASAKDETKQVLCGVHFILGSDDSIDMSATDGHRLARYRQPGTVEVEVVTTNEFTIPNGALHTLRSLLGDDEDIVNLCYSSDTPLVIFEIGDTTMTTRIIEGQYPALNKLIPRQFEREAWIDLKVLSNSLKRIALFANPKHFFVKMEFDPKEKTLTMQAEYAEHGAGSEAFTIQYTGTDEFKLALNIQYFQAAIAVLGTQEIAIKMNGPLQPVVCEPLNGYDVLCLLMPVELQK